MLTVGSLFAGIGGFDLGLERAGMKIKWQIEKDVFCRKVLAKHWKNVKRYKDIREVEIDELEPVDIICGGFPCQPFSQAGQRKGKKDDRYLWDEMFRVIRGVRPDWVIGENVAGIINMELDNVLSDMENEGYTTRTFVIPACAVNAPHRRDRVWIVAKNTNGKRGGRRCEGCGQILESKKTEIEVKRPDCKDRNRKTLADPEIARTRLDERRLRRLSDKENKENIASNTNRKHSKKYEQGNKLSQESREKTSRWCLHGTAWEENWVEVAARVCGVDDGISRRVDRTKRLKALGNAVVPQIVEVIGRTILEIEEANK